MQSETSRVEAFSDGVFAIAITLLILELKVPHRNQGSLATGLLRQWPSYVAYLLSFFFVGIMWINHHRMFNLIRKTDDGLMILNLLLLLGVSVVPFPTEVLAEHLGGPDQKVAALFYNSVWVVVAIIFNVLWRYAVSRHLLDKSISSEHAANISRQYAFGPALYAICFLLVWVDVRVSVAANIALAAYFLIPPNLLRRT